MNPKGTRIFRIRAANGKPLSNVPGIQTALSISTNDLYYDIETHHNQLLIMSGDFQQEFKHEIPAEKRNLNAERVSITLRAHKK